MSRNSWLLKYKFPMPFLSLLLALGTVGCGDSVDTMPPGEEQAQGQAATSDEIKTTDPDSQYRSHPDSFAKNVDCRDAQAKAADSSRSVAGIELGMSLADAVLILRCHGGEKAHYTILQQAVHVEDPLGHVTEQGISYIKGRRISACDDKAMKARNPSIWQQRCILNEVAYEGLKEKIEVLAPGSPGQQRVVQIVRTQYLEPGAQPPAEQVRDMLIKRYGQPLNRRLAWLLGSTTGNTGDCTHNLQPRSGVRSFQNGCGSEARAEIEVQDPEGVLAREISVAVVDHELALSMSEELSMWVKLRTDQAKKDHVRDAAPAENLGL